MAIYVNKEKYRYFELKKNETINKGNVGEKGLWSKTLILPKTENSELMIEKSHSSINISLICLLQSFSSSM